MSEQKLTKEDRWLIRNWKRAQHFEDAMYSERQRYQDLLHEVHKRVEKKYPKLKEWNQHELSGKVKEADWRYGGGCVGFSHPKWRRWSNSWPTGIWVSNISLDELVTEGAPKPTASIWLSSPKRDDKRIERVRNRLVAKSTRLRGRRSIHFRERDENDPQVCLCYDLPEEPRRLLAMVLQDGGQPFVGCIAGHVELMAGLLQGLDDLLP
jgi:hypothetical protein